MLTIIAYDVVEDGRRQKVARLLQSYGERMQLSVFEAHLSDTELRHLRSKLRKLINPQTDSVRYYRLGHASQVDVDGLGMLLTNPDYVLA
jgi:CRISPR-associated protein Cas2